MCVAAWWTCRQRAMLTCLKNTKRFFFLLTEKGKGDGRGWFLSSHLYIMSCFLCVLYPYLSKYYVLCCVCHLYFIRAQYYPGMNYLCLCLCHVHASVCYVSFISVSMSVSLSAVHAYLVWLLYTIIMFVLVHVRCLYIHAQICWGSRSGE